ncbi:MAG: C-terminal helicase domain-containing protein [Stellaceae bacterium]
MRALLAPHDGTHDGGKVAALGQLLAQRSGKKTIVFTAARATARALARALGWRRIAVAGAGGAEIASGRIPLDQALAWFAPNAQRVAPPATIHAIDTLIATDLVSEGLDLQDADGVVHYDLPWTPLRLAQRLGRIARLGTTHRRVTVWWLTPPAELDDRLRLSARLAAKAFAQRRLGTSAARRVGHAHPAHGAFHWRERLALLASPETASSWPSQRWHGVRDVRAAAFALAWGGMHHRVELPELLVLAGDPPAAAETFEAMSDRLDELCAAPGAATRAPDAGTALRETVRQRLASAGAPATNQSARTLARSIVRHARGAAGRRDVALLDRLDQSLTRVEAGLATGAERALADLLKSRVSVTHLDHWLSNVLPPPISATPSVRVIVALVGIA